MERGTLYQIRNMINRCTVKKTPKSNVNASEDFLEVVVTGYVLAAVQSYLGMSSFDDMPLESEVTHDICIPTNYPGFTGNIPQKPSLSWYPVQLCNSRSLVQNHFSDMGR